MDKLTLFSIFAIFGIALLTTTVRCRLVKIDTDVKENEATVPKSSPGELQETQFEEVEEEPVCICTMEFNPVCGSNHRTYANPCEFRCHADTRTGERLNLYIKHFGECMN